MPDEAVWVGWLEDLVTSVEIAALIGVSRQRLHQMVREGKFPPPAGRVGGVDVWTHDGVDPWLLRELPHPYRRRQAGGH